LILLKKKKQTSEKIKIAERVINTAIIIIGIGI